jgi:hypothetical protein
MDNQNITIVELGLPARSLLEHVNVHYASVIFDTRRTPLLRELNAALSIAPWQLVSITHCPMLEVADFNSSLLNSNIPDPISGKAGGALTQQILSNLNTTNPLLRILYFQSTPLPFGSDPTSPNWPVINCPLCTELILVSLPQLKTNAADRDINWLQGLPSLLVLQVNLPKGVVVDTLAFNSGSLDIYSINLARTMVVGDLVPFAWLADLQYLILDNTGFSADLPDDIHTIWPSLQVLSAVACFFYGALPRFANLPALTLVDLSQ